MIKGQEEEGGTWKGCLGKGIVFRKNTKFEEWGSGEGERLGPGSNPGHLKARHLRSRDFFHTQKLGSG